jgi:hypothetical protein
MVNGNPLLEEPGAVFSMQFRTQSVVSNVCLTSRGKRLKVIATASPSYIQSHRPACLA